MSRFRWWHWVKGHHLAKFLAPDRPVTFVKCRNCPNDKGWAAPSTKRELQTLPKASI
jgi:hypothetical protein